MASPEKRGVPASFAAGRRSQDGPSSHSQMGSRRNGPQSYKNHQDKELFSFFNLSVITAGSSSLESVKKAPRHW